VTVELRSLNNRFADLKLRLPQELAGDESALRRLLMARIRRGRVELSLTLERVSELDGTIALNRSAVQALVAEARAAQSEFGIGGELDIRTVLSIPEVFRRPKSPDELDSASQSAVHAAVESALASLDAERRREGDALVAEIVPRLTHMLAVVDAVKTRAAGQPVTLRDRLLERVEALAPGITLDPGRLAQEAAFLADRSDVTEELVRLSGHLVQARQLLAQPDGEPVGKRLDFLLQEIHREINTVNSKSPDLEISRHALELKSEAEKVREQIQNLE
jgi:uncharacterized protein (TIGR00255 family)